MNKRTSGFTLMEIMVVIIIIAVLASVAGPMITGITDQGKASATKSQLSNLKTALINFNNDMGQYPHAKNGDATNRRTTTNYADDAGGNGLADSVEGCCLTTNNVVGGTNWNNLGITATTYNRRWKGPYMEGDPIDFFTDSWGNAIRYGCFKKVLYLQSAGTDGSFSPVSQVIGNKTYESDGGDDIVIQVSRMRRAFTGNDAKTPKGF